MAPDLSRLEPVETRVNTGGPVCGGVTVDVYRPPARLGPRWPLWLRLTVLWAATLLVYALTLALLAPLRIQGGNPSIVPGFALVVLVISLSASVVLVYAQLRLATDASLMARGLQARGFPVGDPVGGNRPSDPEERRALRRLKRGAITRREYEKIIARRHFVHGELSRTQYEEIVHELDETNVDQRRDARAPPGPV